MSTLISPQEDAKRQVWAGVNSRNIAPRWCLLLGRFLFYATFKKNDGLNEIQIQSTKYDILNSMFNSRYVMCITLSFLWHRLWVPIKSYLSMDIAIYLHESIQKAVEMQVLHL